jgi:hypothetical protein
MRAGTSNIKGNLYTGGWQLIYENLLTSAATSVTISGLDGNTDKEYKLVTRIVNGYNGGCGYALWLNNDTGSNYPFQILYGSNATASAAQSTTAKIILGNSDAINKISQSDTLIYAKSGYVRTSISKQARSISGTTVSEIMLLGQCWNNTADNITSMVIGEESGYANCLGIGTHILLFARRIKQSTQLEGSLELYKGKLQAGVMQTIYETTLTEAATSVTISGLDGNTDILYELECRFVNGYNGNTVYSGLANNDSTSSNYGRQSLYGESSTAGASRSTSAGRIFATYCSALNEIAMLEGILYVKSGYVRTSLVKEIRSITGTTVYTLQFHGYCWNNTADNITSLVILADQTNGLGIGTYIRLKALRKTS